ncbi:MAG: protein kinase [Cenarchaeum symbiont of Oopsacas minuta]|nr:protein kinase [Cenarchaeum symbiont of Oopsacas minuta]
MNKLVSGIKKGRRGDVARAITIVENDPIMARDIIKEIFKDSKKRATVIGITGPAGAGKSSLINSMIVLLEKQKQRPAVLAVDPTSSITGGALLGDRTRMAESMDAGTFIRSLASRGAVGALAHSVRNCIRILEYAGFEPILLESVGAGQTETAISEIADATVVVFNPQTGDSIQAIKAGLTEIGDVYVINKSDLAGSAQLYNAVQDYIVGINDTPVLKTSVKRNMGITRLVKEMMNAASIKIGDKEIKNMRIRAELRDIVLNIITDKTDLLLEKNGAYKRWITKIKNKKIDPYSAALAMTRGLIK